MLSHRNMLSIAAAVPARNQPLSGDVFLLVLPLAHCFDRVVGCYLPMMSVDLV
jgi:long-chain acyl-CoA synthetase